MFKLRSIKVSVLFLSLISAVAFSSCSLKNYISTEVSGSYTAKDWSAGSLKIGFVEYSGNNDSIAIYFINPAYNPNPPADVLFKEPKYLVLVLDRFRGKANKLVAGGTSKFKAYYKSHKWEKQGKKSDEDIIVTLNEVCEGQDNDNFFIKISMDLDLRDCEKSILTFSCKSLLVHSDVDPMTVNTGCMPF